MRSGQDMERKKPVAKALVVLRERKEDWSGHETKASQQGALASSSSICPDWRCTPPSAERSSPLVLLVAAVVDDLCSIHIWRSVSRRALCVQRLHRRGSAP